MAETKAAKALRYVSERRLVVERVGGDFAGIVARCRGDSGALYALGWDPRRKEWRCQCEANTNFHRTCSHLLALQMVVTKPAA